ncbi:CocE/NonD family hydrolase [Paractinoplanes rishiriensis]|uniref:Hydrolase n=1 Tax=Paractinoplanes rishiriensis TaxID=1050105 RepID=A0A919JQP9_9ACTN|nr:CocE/NonD family hydrolase [Actinoplanes rishiriensis]GIE92998.1 hydrolase [Actinoplanes rishiriensis]
MRPLIRDRLLARVLRLPGPAGAFRVERGLCIPMRDGVTLSADHYAPAGAALGTVLVRGPYGRGFPFGLLYARPYAAAGYHVVFVSSRGTSASGGDFDPMRTERQDGVDVVAWLTAQPWFTGRFATVGPSYLGYTQWALLEDPPPELAAAVITVGPHDFARHSWGTGAFNLDLVGWTDMIINQPRSDQHPGPVRGQLAQARRAPARRRAMQRVFTELPLADAGERWYAGRAPWFRERVTRPDLDDPYWQPMRHPAALERANIPILLLTGWQDLFVGQSIEQYRRLHERGVDVALTVGPWTHVETIGKAAGRLVNESLDWLGAHLAGRAPRARALPVRVHVTGAREWRELAAWPPPTTELALPLAEPGAPAASFTFDPADPTPTLGGPLLDGGGYVNDGALAGRPDVLAITGEPLAAALEIHGSPVVELRHRSDNPHADLFVRISEVNPRGRSRNVTEGYRRLTPGQLEPGQLEPGQLEPGQLVRLTLLPVAHRFAAGSRIRVLIAGGSHPQYARNLGTDDNPGTGRTLATCRHTIDVGESRVLLPAATG